MKTLFEHEKIIVSTIFVSSINCFCKYGLAFAIYTFSGLLLVCDSIGLSGGIFCR